LLSMLVQASHVLYVLTDPRPARGSEARRLAAR
jgi:hypothetical protein